MITSIATCYFTHQDSVTYNGKIHHSYYNHNYYVSLDGTIILEESDDDTTMSYWRVNPDGSMHYYGCVMSDCYGIFDKEYDGFPSRNDLGIIALDSDFC